MTNGGGVDAAANGEVGWDFFVSYTKDDQSWAEWIAWQLEEAGFRVLVQAWDFVPGSHWMTRLADGVRGAYRVIAVISDAYSRSPFERAMWEEALAADPDGLTRRVIPIRVEDCDRPVLLNRVQSFDLFGLTDDEARAVLLGSIQAAVEGRGKPNAEPHYSGTVIPPAPATRSQPQFPGSDQSVSRILHLGGARASPAGDELIGKQLAGLLQYVPPRFSSTVTGPAPVALWARGSSSRRALWRPARTWWRTKASRLPATVAGRIVAPQPGGADRELVFETVADCCAVVSDAMMLGVGSCRVVGSECRGGG